MTSPTTPEQLAAQLDDYARGDEYQRPIEDAAALLRALAAELAQANIDLHIAQGDAAQMLASTQALRAELEGLKAQQWLPIETAPKDGAEFIAYKPKIGQLIVTYLDADHPDYGGDTPHVTWDYQDLWDATHWMPLPAPPTGEV